MPIYVDLDDSVEVVFGEGDIYITGTKCTSRVVFFRGEKGQIGRKLEEKDIEGKMPPVIFDFHQSQDSIKQLISVLEKLLD